MSFWWPQGFWIRPPEASRRGAPRPRCRGGLSFPRLQLALPPSGLTGLGRSSSTPAQLFFVPVVGVLAPRFFSFSVPFRSLFAFVRAPLSAVVPPSPPFFLSRPCPPAAPAPFPFTDSLAPLRFPPVLFLPLLFPTWPLLLFPPPPPAPLLLPPPLLSLCPPFPSSPPSLCL